MKKNLVLDTSLEATFKDGSIKNFKSIEEASKETGLSIASIKIRANKPGSGGKDKTTFRWLNEHTAAHYRAKKSKHKGGSWEYEIVKNLKDIGYKGCVTSRGESKKIDNSKIDIIDTNNELPINIQAKAYANTPNYFGIREECPDKSKPFVVLWKKSPTGGSMSPGSIAMVDIDYFYHLLKLEKENL